MGCSRNSYHSQIDFFYERRKGWHVIDLFSSMPGYQFCKAKVNNSIPNGKPLPLCSILLWSKKIVFSSFLLILDIHLTDALTAIWQLEETRFTGVLSLYFIVNVTWVAACFTSSLSSNVILVTLASVTMCTLAWNSLTNGIFVRVNGLAILNTFFPCCIISVKSVKDET